MIPNNETPHILQDVREYINGGGSLQWIAQVNKKEKSDMANAVSEAVNADFVRKTLGLNY